MDWTFEDEQYWQSLLASEPANAQPRRNYTPTREEEDTMIQLQRNNTPSGNETPKGVQFLSPRHVTSSAGFRAEIYKVTTDKPDNFGNPVVVYLKSGNLKYSKGFKYTSDLLADLVAIHGSDETKWLKKSILINKTSTDEGGERLTFAK